jgi:hypothetical protein
VRIVNVSRPHLLTICTFNAQCQTYFTTAITCSRGLNYAFKPQQPLHRTQTSFKHLGSGYAALSASMLLGHPAHLELGPLLLDHPHNRQHQPNGVQQVRSQTS